MLNIKQVVHDIADHLPEQATFDDAMYALYVRQKLEEGRIYAQGKVELQLLDKRPS